MADRDEGATVHLAATIARGRYAVDCGTMIEGVYPDTLVEMSLAAKREVDSLRAEIARVTAERDEAIAIYNVSDHQRDEACRDRDRAMAERDAARADLARMTRDLADECARLRAENARLREAMPTDDERDAIELVSLGDDDSFERQFIREYLARLDAAKEVR